MKTILEALDAMALALAEHGHQWTDLERSKYETAVVMCKEYMKGSYEISICGTEYIKKSTEEYKNEY